MNTRFIFFIIFIISLFLSACDTSSSNSDSDSTNDFYKSINSSETAYNVAYAMYIDLQDFVDSFPDGVIEGQNIEGTSGYAIVSGDIESSSSSSSSTVSDSSKKVITIDAYKLRPDNQYIWLTGKINYEFSSSSTTTSTSYKSALDVVISGEDVEVTFDDAYGEDYRDTIDFTITDKNGNKFLIQGNVTNNEGVSFTID
jgi:hypothetical protein